MELNREQIVKALECCRYGGRELCDECPYEEYRDCKERREGDTISFVKELIEENERLKAELAERPPKLIITKKPKGEAK